MYEAAWQICDEDDGGLDAWMELGDCHPDFVYALWVFFKIQQILAASGREGDFTNWTRLHFCKIDAWMNTEVAMHKRRHKHYYHFGMRVDNNLSFRLFGLFKLVFGKTTKVYTISSWRTRTCRAEQRPSQPKYYYGFSGTYITTQYT